MKTCIPEELVTKLKESLDNGEIGTEQIAKMLPEEKEALRSILENVVSEDLGIKVSAEEIAEIKKISEKIESAQEKLGDNLGNPKFTDDNVEFFKAKEEMDNYLQSQVPQGNLKVATGTIARSAMLASVKSPIVNIISNMEQGFTEALSRRIASGQFVGANNEMAVDYIKMVNKIYQETGYDVSRMFSIDEGALGSDVLKGQTVSAQGPGVVRKIGRVAEDVVFKQLMGAPDVMFSAASFADSVNLNALKIANGNKVLASEYMEDAMRINPQTEEGQMLRTQAVGDAQVATWTNTTWASRVSSGIRGIINEVSGDLRIGDYLLPFIKTPANIIATGMDYAGLGAVKSIAGVVKGIKDGNISDPQTLQPIIRNALRAGIGMTLALLIVGALDDDDFVGAYDPKRSQIEQLRNSNYNAIKIGDKWVSVDLLGPLAIPVTSMMYARKYGKAGLEKAFQYGKASTIGAATQIPGIKDIYDTVKSDAYKKNQGISELGDSTVNYAAKEVVGRFIPSISGDIAKALDPYIRDTSKGALSPIVAKIPVLSKTLPVKKNIFGEDIKGESAINDILIGARIKTDRSDATINEINKVSQDTDKGVSFTDWNKSSSKQITQFEDKVGKDKFEKAKNEYGQELKKQLDTLVTKPAYKRMNPEDKLKAITAQDTQAMDKIFKKYGFKYKQEKSVKVKGL